MALGGGTFLVQNKVLPGSYINFVSNATANNFGERGTGCIGTFLDWFDDELTECTAAEFMSNSYKLFGYAYDDLKVAFAREFFKNGTKLYVGNVGGAGTKATAEGVTAKKYGVRGNDIQVIITANVDDNLKYDVKTYLGTKLVASVIGTTSLTSADSNDFVDFGSITISAAETLTLTGGAGTRIMDGTSLTAFLTKAERKSFNAITVVGNWNGTTYVEANVGGSETSGNATLLAFTKRMRDEVGVKFQCVEYVTSAYSNYEGAVDVQQAFTYTENGTTHNGNQLILAWVCGAIAGCAVNKSLTNFTCDSEFTIKASDELTQSQLETAINNSRFVFHYVGDSLRVLEDINSLKEFTPEKAEIFKYNQTIRVCDQIAVDVAAIFNDYYLGKVPNDSDGRVSFWNEIVKHHQKLNDIRAIEDFNGEDVTVAQGETKQAVVVNDAITPVNAMEKLYMTVYVS